MTEHPLLVGVNLPWFCQGYGHDLGRNAAYPNWPTYYDAVRVRQLLESLAANGLQLLRIWLFEDGEGLLYDADGRVTGLDAAFRHNLANLVHLLRELSFRVYWTLLDANSVSRRNDHITRSLLISPEAMAEFCKRALPEVLAAISDVSWAIDLCNEPEAVIAGDDGNRTGLGFGWWEIQPALLTLRQAVAQALPGIPVSIGSGYQDHRNVESGLYNRLGLDLDFSDFHSHRNDVPLIHAGGLWGERPIVVGELGILLPSGVHHSRQAWRRCQRTLVRSLHQATSRGYGAAFLWYLSDLGQADATGLVYLNEIGLTLHSLADLQTRGLIRLSPGQVFHVPPPERG